MNSAPSTDERLAPKGQPKKVPYTHRASLVRRSTQGPLEVEDDPLADHPPEPPSRDTPPSVEKLGTSNLEPFSIGASTTAEDNPSIDFGFLLRPEIYHKLSQVDTPVPFRTPPLAPNRPLEKLLSTGHFGSAATAAASLLTQTPPPPPSTIFSLLYTRLASLTLINATPFAAQESKALQDLTSPFYRHPTTNAHILPWELRVLAVRLQGIGYGDLKRGVVGYYDLARDARTEISKTAIQAEKEFWRARLRDLGIRVANALIEMGDLSAAARHLESLRIDSARGNSAEEEAMTRGRLALLNLRVGKIAAAKQHVRDAGANSPYTQMLAPLLSVADGNYTAAVSEFETLRDGSAAADPLIMQNLAVCLLYSGKVTDARRLLEELVADGHSFHTLTFNLSTVYELCTERSRDWKMRLAEKIAGLEGREGSLGLERGNVDFKL